MSKHTKLDRARKRAEDGAARLYPSFPEMTIQEAARVSTKRRLFVAGALWWRATDGHVEHEIGPQK